jgi:hypothetical protein
MSIVMTSSDAQLLPTNVVVTYDNRRVEPDYNVIDTPSIGTLLQSYDTTSLSSLLATQQVILDDMPVVILFNTCE